MDSISIHYSEDRRQRQAFINDCLGLGDAVDSFMVDRGHPGGSEIHTVTTTGLIVIRNARTGKLITCEIARPEQLRRLYRAEDRTVPKKILSLAYKHNRKRHNEK